MDFDSSSKFVASLAKFLQSLCNGYVDFDKGVEVIGHIHINVDSDLGKKVDYVLNERVCKNDNSITFISNSFPAQPAEKPQPPPKKAPESDKSENEQSVVMDDSGQMVPNSTNVGTIGSYRNASRNNSTDSAFNPGSKRPRSPLQRRNMPPGGNPLSGKPGVPRSPRYQDSGGPLAKIGRSDIRPGSVGGSDYDGANVFQGGDEEDYSTNYGDQNVSEVDQKPIIDPDISIVKEEYMANQQQSSCAYAGGNQMSGPSRGKHQSASPYSSQSMIGQTPYAGANIQHPQPEMYTNSPLENAPGDPSTLTRAQQEELEMYYRKGTDQHLTFLRNMREAHAMYPFTGKRDKELFEKALAEVNSSHLGRVHVVVTNMEDTPTKLSKVTSMEAAIPTPQFIKEVTVSCKVQVRRAMTTNNWRLMIAGTPSSLKVERQTKVSTEPLAMEVKGIHLSSPRLAVAACLQMLLVEVALVEQQTQASKAPQTSKLKSHQCRSCQQMSLSL